MFAVIYRWRVRQGAEQQFRQAWEVVTRELMTSAGGLGSRLHRSSDGSWVAYAVWPSRQTWEEAKVVSHESQIAMDSMAAAVEERLEPMLLEPVADYLVDAAK